MGERIKKKKNQIKDNFQLNVAIVDETLENVLFIRIFYVINNLMAIFQWNMMIQTSIPRNDTWEWTAPA